MMYSTIRTGRVSTYFGKYEGRLEAAADPYRFRLSFWAVDGHAKGVADFKTSSSAAEGLSEFDFAGLSCDPAVMLEMCAAGLDCEFAPQPTKPREAEQCPC